MRLSRTRSVFLALALSAVPSIAAAQSRIDFVSRSGGTTSVAGPISSRDCAGESWTFRLRVDGTHSGAPDIFLTHRDTCALPSGDASCLSTGVTPTLDTTDCAGATCWRFTLADGWLVDPSTGVCAVSSGGFTRIFAWVDGVSVASPRVRWDTLPPAAPRSVSASFGSESQVQLTWSYPTVTTAEDASVDAADDTTDASADADSDVSDVVDVTDAVASDVPPTSDFESVRRFWVLCDPVTSGDLDASSCTSGGFSMLDVNDDASLLRFASQCGEADGGVATTATSATLTRLALGRQYRFAVVAEDLAGNRSEPAFSTRCSSAQAYTDFWEAYRNGGGNSAVGCAATPRSTSYGSLAALAALGLVVARRRRARSNTP